MAIAAAANETTVTSVVEEQIATIDYRPVEDKMEDDLRKAIRTLDLKAWIAAEVKKALAEIDWEKQQQEAAAKYEGYDWMSQINMNVNFDWKTATGKEYDWRQWLGKNYAQA